MTVKYRVPAYGWAHMALRQHGAWRPEGSSGMPGTDGKVTLFAHRAIPGLGEYRDSREWRPLHFGSGALEDFEGRPIHSKARRVGITGYRIRGHYTVYGPYGETTVRVDTVVDVYRREDLTEEIVQDAVDFFLEENEDLWRESEDDSDGLAEFEAAVC